MPRVAAVGTTAKATLVTLSDGEGTKPQRGPSAAVPDQHHLLLGTFVSHGIPVRPLPWDTHPGYTDRVFPGVKGI